MSEAAEETVDANDASVVFRMRPQTMVYTNPHGDLVIRQEQYPDEDAFVYIEARDVPILIERMMQVMAEAGQDG
jgi:hypothetical protein